MFLLMHDGNEFVTNFGAKSWCVPCQRFEPHYEVAAQKFDIPFYTVDIDTNEWAMEMFNIKSVPTIYFFNGTGVTDLSDPSIRNAPKFIKAVKEVLSST